MQNQLDEFLESNRDVIDKMLRKSMFFQLRDKIIKEEYIKLIQNEYSTTCAVEKLANEYNYSVPTIKMIVYQK